jgi:UDP-N-acetylglucosamine:LPS N-acetylglucosamine transferase
MRRPGTEVCIATSHGGHLELLVALADAYAGRDHLFVTAPSAQAGELEAAGHRVEYVPNPHRSPLRLLRNVAGAIRIARRERPRVVVSSGAGVAVPFCIAARALGARLVFIENMARVERGSVSGRLLYPLARDFLVEWPELRKAFPRAQVCRPALLEDGPAVAPAESPRGTLVAAGTHGQPFDRLLALADDAAGAGLLPEPLTVQGGSSGYRPRNFEARPILPHDEFEQAMGTAEIVLTHGGAGTVSLAIRSGKRPLVLPRRRRHGEHHDDHQVDMVAKLESLGLAVSLDERSLLEALPLGRERPPPVADVLEGPRLADRLREVVEAAL